MPASFVRFDLALLLSAILLGTASAPSPSASSSTVPPDTVTSTVAAGAPLVRSLPTSLDDAPVARYTVLEGPALSGAAGYSFTWITRDTAPGSYAILLRADHPDAAPDTLIVQVTVEAE
jgi:hypothetical protein